MSSTIKPINISYKKGRLPKKKLVELYQQMLLPRMIEEKMLILLRQGKISKWFSGIGQEAISVGVTAALQEEEFIFPMHRNLGVFTTRKIPLERLFGQWQGNDLGFTKGRDRSFHFGTIEHKIVGMISHLGPQLALAGGVALAEKLENTNRIAVAFTGEGGTSEGDFHEALNVASVWQLPVIFIIENNGYGLSTPTREQYNCAHLVDRAKGYGMKSHLIDGNNILEVYQTIDKVAKSIRKNPEPVLIECQTFRMRGHEEASGTKYVPKELMDEWAAKDPLDNYEQYLISEGLLSEAEINTLRKSNKQLINDHIKTAFALDQSTRPIEEEINDVYAPYEEEITTPGSDKTEKRFIDAISDGLDEAMQRYDDLVLMGQDIADYGGVFKITDGFLKKYGANRVRNTPICESSIIGIGLGLQLRNHKAMVEMQFADFVTCGFNQIVNNLAKLHYRWGQATGVVVRMPCGGGVGAGPFHSQSNEAWFTHTPGLKVVYPSTPEDAKGLLLASFEDPNPVLFFEHKALYRSLTSDVPDGYYTTPIGKARMAAEGSALTIVTYGMGVQWALKITQEKNIEADVIDLRTLAPIDWGTIKKSVKKTSRVVVLHEDTLTGGIGGEIAAYIGEHLFEYLDAPVMRCASLDTPIPFAVTLENNFLPVKRLEEVLDKMMKY